MVQYMKGSSCSNNNENEAIRKLFPVLAQSTVYGTSPVINRNGVLLSDILGYTTLNEEYIVQKIIADHQAKKKFEASAWRIGVGLLTTCMGLGDGFQLQDALGGLAAGMLAGRVSDSLQEMDNRQLQELGLEWVNNPCTYMYHRKRHRGDSVRRLLMILPHPHTGSPCTSFGVQFPDGYVAHLGFTPQENEGDCLGNRTFCMSDVGFDAELLPQRQVLGKITCDSGQQLPVEFWANESNDRLVVIPYKAPHHSLY